MDEDVQESIHHAQSGEERHIEAGVAVPRPMFDLPFCFPPSLSFGCVSSQGMVACSGTLSRTAVVILRAATNMMAMVPLATVIELVREARMLYVMHMLEALCNDRASRSDFGRKLLDSGEERK